MRRSLALLAALSAVVVSTPASAQQRGGIITVQEITDVDYLDPGRTYYTVGYAVAFATVRPLYGHFPGDGDPSPRPDLAAAAPAISDGNRTITVPIRQGVRFAPPVNREVQARDVKYAIERAFSRSVGGQYTFYFSDIVGAPSRPPRTPRAIRGITTPDPYTLRIRLSRPVAAQVAAALVMPITAPVPKEVAGADDRKGVSTYNRHVVASGPYMVTRYRIGRSIQLRRNPNWNPASDPRPAYADGFDIDADNRDAYAAEQRVLRGSRMLAGGSVTARTLAGQATRPSQFLSVDSGGTRYLSLNTRIKPLTKLNVRRAIVAGFDRERLRAARGPAAIGKIATHFIPPGVPGFAEAGGDAGPIPELYGHTRGNRALMADYFRKAGYKGGRYRGKARLLVVGANVRPGSTQAREAARQLRSMGFRTRLKLVQQDAVYTEWCQQPRKRVAVCASTGWFKDFNDPQSMLQPLFDGRWITRNGGNNNLAELNVPAINRAMSSASVLPPGPQRLAAWAGVDKQIMAAAPAVPFLWDVSHFVQSADVAGALNPYSTYWDYSFTSIR
ncbi:MAG TPA: ABC transporter substrate-binding protein [Solirubrobacteraceae bacterium]